MFLRQLPHVYTCAIRESKVNKMRALWQRLLLLPSALLAASLAEVYAIDLEERDTRTPKPISSTPDSTFDDGVDGSWSSFTLRVGTPPQYIHTYASWAVYQTWAVLPQGCQWASNYKGCAQTRGGIFNETSSNSFKQKYPLCGFITR